MQTLIVTGLFFAVSCNDDDNTPPLPAIGEPYQGGILAYVDETGKHGLIAAPTDLSVGTQIVFAWWNGSYITTGATLTAIGTGQSNTTKIVQAQGNGSYAAKLCDDLVLNGYSDWFLPSKDELNVLYQNRNLIGGFGSDFGYWSSSQREDYNCFAWIHYFFSGEQVNDDETEQGYRVRAVRAF